MLKFFREQDVAPFVKERIKSRAKIDLAVAFWGRGASELLGITKGDGIRIICNLDHIGTNPSEIKHLIKLGVEVRNKKDLHAKIYRCGDCVIIGSSNASTNGLFTEGCDARGLIEGNVVSNDSELISKIEEFFEAQWNSSEKIDPGNLDAAIKSRQEHRIVPYMKEGIFRACREFPEYYQDFFVVAVAADASKNADKEFKAITRNLKTEKGVNLKNLTFYELGRIRRGTFLVEIDMRGKSPKSNGIYEAISAPTPVPGNNVSFVIPALPSGYRLRKDEKELLIKNAEYIRSLSGGENKVISLSRVLVKLKY